MTYADKIKALIAGFRAQRDEAMDKYHRYGGNTQRGLDAYATAEYALDQLFRYGAACVECEGDVEDGVCQSCGRETTTGPDFDSMDAEEKERLDENERLRNQEQC